MYIESSSIDKIISKGFTLVKKTEKSVTFDNKQNTTIILIVDNGPFVLLNLLELKEEWEKTNPEKVIKFLNFMNLGTVQNDGLLFKSEMYSSEMEIIGFLISYL